MTKKHSFGLNNGLPPNRRQAISWTNADPILWRIYAALGGEELIKSADREHGKTQQITNYMDSLGMYSICVVPSHLIGVNTQSMENMQKICNKGDIDQ